MQLTCTFLSFHLVLHLRTILRKQNDAVTQNILSICFLWIKWNKLARGKNDIPIFMKNVNFWKGVNPIEYFYYNANIDTQEYQSDYLYSHKILYKKMNNEFIKKILMFCKKHISFLFHYQIKLMFLMRFVYYF